MKVIFLDIDGVLNSEQSFIDNHEYYLETGKHKADVCESMVKRLSLIVSHTNACVVMSSSWRGMHRSYKVLNETPTMRHVIVLDKLLSKHNIKIIDYTKSLNGEGISRGCEVREWLSRHPDVTSFVILDDEMFSDWNELKSNLVKTTFYGERGGLQKKHKYEAIKILNK